MNSYPKDGSQSIHRAISLLRAVARNSDAGVQSIKVAREVELHVATARRILLALCMEDFVTQDPVSKLYYLGPGIYSLSNTLPYYKIKNIYAAALDRVAKRTEDTVHLVIRSGYDTLCIDRFEASHAIRIMFDIGMRLPIGVGASGLAILASLPDDEVETILLANHLRFPQYNNMNVQKVRGLVELSRELGYSRNEGNYLKGVTGVGVPISDRDGRVIGGIAVASISERMDYLRCEEIAGLIKSEIVLIKELPDP